MIRKLVQNRTKQKNCDFALLIGTIFVLMAGAVSDVNDDDLEPGKAQTPEVQTRLATYILSKGLGILNAMENSAFKHPGVGERGDLAAKVQQKVLASLQANPLRDRTVRALNAFIQTSINNALRDVSRSKDLKKSQLTVSLQMPLDSETNLTLGETIVLSPPEGISESREKMYQLLEKAINEALSARERTVILMCNQGRPIEEIMEAINANTRQAVYNAKNRAMKALAEWVSTNISLEDIE